MKVVTGEQMREIEKAAIEELGIPSILLMENAALRLTEYCLKAIQNIKNPKVLIICGPGNNGGDGMALARHLHNCGVETKVVFVGDTAALKGDPAVYFKIIKKLGIPVSDTVTDTDLVVDALLGTGLSRNVEGKYKQMIETINERAKYVISVDIPSGVHSGTGQIMGCAVKANETVTFAYPKTGIMVYPGAGYAGKVHTADISLPANSIDKAEVKAQILTDKEAGSLLPARRQRSNKGSYGKILIFAGSNEMPGAAALASSAAYMTGGGLVCACVLQNVANVIHHWQREVVTRILPDKNGLYCKESFEAAADEIKQADVIVVGPGIGRSRDVTEFVHEIITKAQAPLVLDADALFAVSEDAHPEGRLNILKKLKAPCIITPHPGEMSRLASRKPASQKPASPTVPEILDNIIDTAVKFSQEFNVITLLKDARTIIAHPDGNYFINTTGNDALSKAGTGDVLTGMIAGFIAQGSHSAGSRAPNSADIFTAGILGAYIHGKSGEAAALRKSRYGVTAGDLLAQIPPVINQLQGQTPDSFCCCCQRSPCCAK